MELSVLQELLIALKSRPSVEQTEPNIFSIGARGHYENPVSDLLAFFIDPDGGHDLGTLVLEAFLKRLPGSPNISLLSPPDREVITSTGNRIDIILESDSWVMALENKIWHQQNNPFSDYRQHLCHQYPDKAHFLVVLSPDGTAPSGWFGMSYWQFLNVLSPKLRMAYAASPQNKWLVLLREFILHLESLMNKNAITPETEWFVLDNLHSIQEMILLKNAVIKSLQEECLRFLKKAFGYRGYKVKTTLNHWEGFPALRFSFSHWITSSDVVLFLDRTPGKSFEIRIYVCDLVTAELYDRAKKVLRVKRYHHRWDERSRQIFVASRFIDSHHVDKNLLFEQVAEGMDILDEFEHRRELA
ncbi:TPA: PD-(D/E)XK nuclease family protein [Citrobacter koseri]|nr:PD-(D/E)XK nuclease family protein [Citrobacter koseri]